MHSWAFGVVVLAQSSDQLDQLKDALTSSQVSGWDVVAAIAVLALSIPVGALVRRFTIRALRRVPNLTDEIAGLGGRMSRWLVFLIALAWALSLLGTDVDWVVIVVAVVLVVGVFMLRPLVENMAAGLALTARPAFDEGDRIKTSGYQGTVVEIGDRSTILQTTDGQRVHIPNTDVVSDAIIVYTASDSLKSAFDIAVAFETDLERLTPQLLKAVSTVEGVQQDPAPSVQATDFANNAITLTVSYWYPSSMKSGAAVTDGAIRACKKVLVDADVRLAVPAVDVEEASSTANRSGPQRPPSATA
jgi:small-conductance mechanosensitive channel